MKLRRDQQEFIRVLKQNPETLDDVKKEVRKIQKFVNNNDISYWRDYVLGKIKLNKKYSEKYFEEAYKVYFCNGLKYDIDEVELVYSSYDGILSLVPVGDHESYFNFIDFDPTSNPDEYTRKVWDLWCQLRLL